MTWSLAIDFGTSNTAAAFTMAGKTRPISLDASSTSMPSAVLLTESGFVTGKTALSRMRVAPQLFEGEPKREIGSAAVTVGDRSFDPAELVAEVFRVVKAKAHDVAGQSEPERVVLTHPQAWTAGQKNTLRRAAELAGFDPATIALVSEPVAAIHYYAVENPPSAGDRVAVVDVGGGTCDIAVLEKHPEGSEFEYSLLAAGGDNVLGGTHFDARLWNWTMQQLAQRNDVELFARLNDPASPRGRLILRDSIRAAKEELSDRADSIIAISAGDAESVVSITRDEYEAIIADDVARIVGLVAGVLRDAGMAPGDVSAFYLTGGASRTPAIIEALRRLTGTAPAKLHDPKLVVAEGALSVPPETQVLAEPAGVEAPAAVLPAEPEPEELPQEVVMTEPENVVAPLPESGDFEYVEPPAVAPQTPWYKGPLIALPIIGGVLLLAIVPVIGVLLISLSTYRADPVDCPDGSTASTLSQCPDVPTDAVVCWDDSTADSSALCPDLVGMDATKWVFPAEDGAPAPTCTNPGPFAPAVESYTCTWEDLKHTTVFLERYTSVDAAYDYWNETLQPAGPREFDNRPGSFWIGKEHGDEHRQWTVYAYSSIPFTAGFLTEFTEDGDFEAENSKAADRVSMWSQETIDASTP